MIEPQTFEDAAVIGLRSPVIGYAFSHCPLRQQSPATWQRCPSIRCSMSTPSHPREIAVFEEFEFLPRR
jgi:hypothetical protein